MFHSPHVTFNCNAIGFNRSDLARRPLRNDMQTMLRYIFICIYATKHLAEDMKTTTQQSSHRSHVISSEKDASICCIRMADRSSAGDNFGERSIERGVPP